MNDTPHRAWIHGILFYRGTIEFQAAIFLMHIVIAALFTIGIQPRITTPLLWVATVCMHGRQECFHDGSDKYFRNLLLWSCFMDLCPISKQPRKQAVTQLSIGTVGFIFQMCLMYAGVISYRFRYGKSWFDGTAVGYALSSSFATRPPATFLTDHPQICKVMTFSGLIGEAIIPIVILITSYRTPILRSGIFFGILAVHAGIYFLFYLPQWSLFASLAAVLLLPPAFLDAAEAAFPALCRVWYQEPLMTVTHSSHTNSTPPPFLNDSDKLKLIGANEQNESVRIRKSPQETSDQLPLLQFSSTPVETALHLRQRHVAEPVRKRPVSFHTSNGKSILGIGKHTDGLSEKPAHATNSVPNNNVHSGLRNTLDVHGNACVQNTDKQGTLILRVIGVFLFVYMCHEWLATETKLFKSLDNGDIGQVLRFYQGWVMFINPQGRGKWWSVYARVPVRSTALNKEALGSLEMISINVLASIRDNKLVVTEENAFEEDIRSVPNCTSCLYPSWRYERFLDTIDTYGLKRVQKGIWPLSRHWCHMLKTIGDHTLEVKNITLSDDAFIRHIYWGDMQIRTALSYFKTFKPTSQNPRFRRYPIKTAFDVRILCHNWPEFNS